MTELRHEIEIDAASEEVWRVLMDFRSYPEWNPFIVGIEGEARLGARLKVRIAPPGGRALTVRPTVRKVEDGREFRWLGHLFVPGVFDGEHSFSIDPLAEGRSRFVQSERFSGFLVGLLRGVLDKTGRGFEEMNSALKARLEAGD